MDQKPDLPDFPYFPDQLPERYREFTPPVWVEKPGLRPALNPFPAAKAHPFFGRQLGKWPFAFVLLLEMVGTVFLFTTGTVSQVAFAALIATAFITGFLFVTFVVIALTATVLRELVSRLKPTGNPTVPAIPSFRGVSIIVGIVFAIISISARHNSSPSSPAVAPARYARPAYARANYRPTIPHPTYRFDPPVRTQTDRPITPELKLRLRTLQALASQLETKRHGDTSPPGDQGAPPTEPPGKAPATATPTLAPPEDVVPELPSADPATAASEPVPPAREMEKGAANDR